MLIAAQYSASSESLAQCEHGGQHGERSQCQTCNALADLAGLFSHVSCSSSNAASIKKLGLLPELRESFAASRSSTTKAATGGSKSFFSPSHCDPKDAYTRDWVQRLNRLGISIRPRLVIRFTSTGLENEFRFLLRSWLRMSLAKDGREIYQLLPTSLAAGQSVPEAPLPARLLDILPSDDAWNPKAARGWKALFQLANHLVRVVTPPPGSYGRYATFSHQWGKEQQLRLTSRSQKEFESGLLLCSLPKTYQDAVKVARILGYRYLWIDALCILQDSDEDLGHASSIMSSAYRNSSVTIASHFADKDAGFFSILKSDSSDFTRDICNSSLSSRGWFFQERLLSRRVLHFSPNGLFLEDASGVLCLDRHSRLARPTEYEPRIDNKFNLEELVHSSAQWYHAVERYSSCALTRPVDRLSAIEGLAGYYSENALNAGEYVCGIWENSLHQGLLWVLGEEDQMELESSSDIMSSPSWSWARWSGRILYPQHLPTVVSEISQADVDFPDPICKEPKLYMELDPPLLTLDLRILEWENISAVRLSHPKQVAHFPQAPISVYHFRDQPWSHFSLDNENRQVVHFDKITLALTSRNDDKRYLYDEHADRVIQITECMYYFLILQRVDGGGQERYRRVGLGWVGSKSCWKRGRMAAVSIV